jgi:hypothetical protein
MHCVWCTFKNGPVELIVNLLFVLSWINWYFNCWWKAKFSEGTSTDSPAALCTRSYGGVSCPCWQQHSLWPTCKTSRSSIPDSQSHFMFRPKIPLWFLWKHGSATEAFGCMCLTDSVGTRVRRWHVPTSSVDSSPNILDAGVEPSGLQSETGDCPISFSEWDHSTHLILSRNHDASALQQAAEMLKSSGTDLKSLLKQSKSAKPVAIKRCLWMCFT